MDIDPEVYRNAKSTRPAWANALIIATVIFIAALLVTVMSGLGPALWLYLATLITLLIAGVLALTRIRS